MEKNKILLAIFLIPLGIILLVLSFFIDNRVLAVTNSLKNPLLDNFMGWITHFGNVFLVLIVITSLFLWEEKKREWIPTLWCSFIVSICIAFILKVVIAKPRPINDMFYLISVLNYSFPSMHTAAAFAALPVLDKEFPMFKWFWILFAVLISISRIYVGAHYLSDVVAGALLGYAVGCLFVYIEDKYRVFRKIRLGFMSS